MDAEDFVAEREAAQNRRDWWTTLAKLVVIGMLTAAIVVGCVAAVHRLVTA